MNLTQQKRQIRRNKERQIRCNKERQIWRNRKRQGTVPCPISEGPFLQETRDGSLSPLIRHLSPFRLPS